VSEPARAGWLDRIERAGNALPDPATLFALGALAVALGSELAWRLDWQIEKTVTRPARERVLDAEGAPLIDPATGKPLERARVDAQGELVQERHSVVLRPTRLLSADGIYWTLASLVDNFTRFPPLGVVLVGMLGIGLAERTGLMGAALKALLLAVPARLLTPALVFAGVMSSLGSDAGYVVLPPVAAALFHALGRPPLAGLAATFAGVAGGFCANLAITSLDPLLAELSSASARLVDPGYAVDVRANWYLMIASAFLLTGLGWAVTAGWVEPRLARAAPDAGGPGAPAAGAAPPALAPVERRALGLAAGVAALCLSLYAAAALVPGAPLHGVDGPFPRWVRAIVPGIFFGFLLPALVYGARTGALRSDKDVARMLGESMAGMGPYLVLAFFAGQFIAWFAYSGLGEMLALAGGRALVALDPSASLLLVGFVAFVLLADVFVGSMSAKYAFLAPVFVPMFMQVGISPELTQAAYRIGDSVTNMITPLNPYMVIVLVFVQRYAPRAGIGTLVAMMLPYFVCFAAAWTLLLLAWVALGIPLGPGGPLFYEP
jgi:aminobenzoyl-glutamate transport protein